MGLGNKKSNEASILFSSEEINPIQERSQKEGVSLTNHDLLTIDLLDYCIQKCKRSMGSFPRCHTPGNTISNK